MSKSIVFFSTVLVFLFSFSYATPGIATFYTSYTRKNFCVFYYQNYKTNTNNKLILYIFISTYSEML